MAFFKKILDKLRGEQPLGKLIKRGLKVGKNLTRMSGVVIDPSHCWHIEIGDNVILAPNVHILAHDASTKPFLNYTRIANIKIGSRVFIGAGAIILPGVSIGDDVVIGAGSIVSKNIPANSLAVGSPAKVICSLDAYIEKEKIKMNADNVFHAEYTLRNPQFSDKHKTNMIEACKKHGQAFVE
ncbi:MAG: acetyltransferase [Porphyromonadaceae bacterium CG2_30_38_12]|nr:MAG: acetyltransferase [Porphyromonadaceae bacterium CG2_30_38_12]